MSGERDDRDESGAGARPGPEEREESAEGASGSETPGREGLEGWESLGEEPESSMSPSPELEEALREAAESVGGQEAGPQRAGERSARGESGGEGGGDGGELEEARREIQALRGELEGLRERFTRLQADFENHRRRALKEREEAHQYGHENLVKDLLGTVDNLDRAVEHARESGGGDFESMLQGVELVRRELLGALHKHGVTEIEADGAPFDPNVHEAMAQAEDDSVPPGTVVQVYQKGYRLRDRLLRPARVVVSKPSESGEDAAQ